jgi:hypothetical protein
MRKLRIAALIALTLIAVGAGASVKEVFAEPLLDEDFVSQLMAGEPSEPNAPIRVVFGHHAAIYLLDRKDPHFAAYFDILQSSLKERTRVRFDYAVEGPRLTLVEPAQ